ncbi:hypothetical protein [uncultured Campylobacter sp.]|nr:hypothetical protein [uncultured Campylobacter sp.]
MAMGTPPSLGRLRLCASAELLREGNLIFAAALMAIQRHKCCRMI